MTNKKGGDPKMHLIRHIYSKNIPETRKEDEMYIRQDKTRKHNKRLLIPFSLYIPSDVDMFIQLHVKRKKVNTNLSSVITVCGSTQCHT